MNDNELLEAAADLLEEDGWCRNRLEDEQQRRCVYGAILAADTGQAEWWGSASTLRMPVYARIAERIQAHVGIAADVASGDSIANVVYWNNRIAKDGQEVVRVLREVAAEPLEEVLGEEVEVVDRETALVAH